MTACLLPYDITSESYNNNKYRFSYIPKIAISCNINKTKLIDIIYYSLQKVSELTVFGFNKQYNEFWAKRIVKNNYLLHFTISIQSYGLENSNIVISPLVGNDKEIKMFVNKIKEFINLFNA